ncbi:class I adenylate-forming enzyme family protein [Variovorax sp. M-6]|uniref:class I adenylate-forming enzyme family protein n=1 Tax=Variovorax sp. M-6 TaxID=3233041 RepID=UPI003F9C636D
MSGPGLGAQGDALRLEALYGDRLVPCYAERPRNLDAMLRASVALRGDAPAVEDGAATLSYRMLDRLADRVASGLAAQRVKSGDRVALFVGNRSEFVVLLAGIWRLGAIAVPIGIRQSAAELGYMLNQCGAAALVFDASLADRLPPPAEMPGVHCTVCIEEGGLDAAVRPGALSYAALLAAGDDAPVGADFEDTCPACIMYTSGTTGHPKGAVLSHLGFFHTARHYVRRFGYTADDRMLLVIPASHISGLLAVVVVALQVGGCLVCLRQFGAGEALAEIEARRVTAAVMVPAMYNLCLLHPSLAARDLSCWRIGHFGGAAMPEITIARLAEALPGLALYNGFGATETTSAVTLTERGDAARKPDTVGTVVPCVDIRVLDTAGREVATGESGELWIRSPGNAIGYWANPAATRDAFVAGYWRSGDIGSIDAEGFVRVFDRIKDMINRGGFKVYCVELENVIQRYPGVIEVAAVASPCPVLGERVHVFVHATEPVDAQAVRAQCRRTLADYKTPDFVTISATPLPRNLNGKLVKAPLRELAREAARQLAANHPERSA